MVVLLAFACFVVDIDLDDWEKLFFDSSPTDGVLFGIIDRPGDDVFLAGGGGVLRFDGTGDFAKDLSGVLDLSRLIGRFRSIGDLLLSFENRGLFLPSVRSFENSELFLSGLSGETLFRSNTGLFRLKIGLLWVSSGLLDRERSILLNKGFLDSSSIIELTLLLPK